MKSVLLYQIKIERTGSGKGTEIYSYRSGNSLAAYIRGER